MVQFEEFRFIFRIRIRIREKVRENSQERLRDSYLKICRAASYDLDIFSNRHFLVCGTSFLFFNYFHIIGNCILLGRRSH